MTQQVVVTQHVSAPPRVVYSYLTESENWAKWQGAEARIEAQPGGTFVMKMADGTTARGRFVELVRDRKVVFTWGWVDNPGVPPGSSTVEIEITADREGSRITLTHRDLPEEETELHETGWRHYLPRLGAAAEGRQLGPDRGPGG